MSSYHNTYYALRHGESVSSRAGLIQSDLEQGQHESLGLTEQGKKDMLTTITRAQSDSVLDRHALIITSPFTRCLETAQIIKDVLRSINPIQIDTRLRERDFGLLNDQSIASYTRVWKADETEPFISEDHIESPTLVQQRTMSLIHELEDRYQGRTILLISHGDTLRILQSGLQQLPAHRHLTTPSFTMGELRKLN